MSGRTARIFQKAIIFLIFASTPGYGQYYQGSYRSPSGALQEFTTPDIMVCGAGPSATLYPSILTPGYREAYDAYKRCKERNQRDNQNIIRRNKEAVDEARKTREEAREDASNSKPMPQGSPTNGKPAQNQSTKAGKSKSSSHSNVYSGGGCITVGSSTSCF